MKTRMLTLIIICITALLTFWMFLDFQKKRKTVSIFHTIVSDAPLSARHLFISPEQLGIHAWNLGDFAAYQLKTNTDRKQITFGVAAQPESPSPNEFWLRVEGLVRFNKVNVDLWRLLSVKSLRPGSESAEVLFAKGAVPFLRQQQRFPPYPVILEPVGEVNVKTESGSFKCQHYFAHLQAPDGSTAPLLELWANSSVLPLGIVRARWRDEVLELVQTRAQPLRDIPEMLSKTIRQRNSQVSTTPPLKETVRHQAEVSEFPSASVCTQCHDGNIGGKHLKLEALTVISGLELDLTHALYHTYAALLAHPHNHLSLQSISQQGHLLSAERVQFTWAKGSFSVSVKTNLLKRLVFSLDEIAHKGNIRVTTTKGRLLLNATPKPL